MRAGKSAPDALRALTAADAGESLRQVAIVDAAGRAAAHTGSRCIAYAGHRTADGVSVQANMMERDTVAGRDARGVPGGERRVRGPAAGGARRRRGGRRRHSRPSSAADTRRRGQRGEKPWWAARTLEMRVEDHPSRS